MFSLWSSLSFTCFLFFTTLALPAKRVIKDSQPNVHERSIISSAFSLKHPEPPNLQAKSNSSIFTSSNNDTSLSYPPICFGPLPDPYFRPISDSDECARLIYEIAYAGGQPQQPVLWTSQRSWTLKECRVHLIPKSQGSRDTFAKSDIANAASIIQTMCDTKEQGYRGGSIRVGPAGVFDVALYGVKTSQQVKRASASSTTSLFNYPIHPAT